ncbi:hypothetical protein [Kribbella sp. NPDC003557]|uniref:hypothetical protein n=1 Tax=Kribbella sp. NPDC003557 TaxID=3154449 RepID=UPI0033B21E6B
MKDYRPGYPIDERIPDQRARMEKGHLGDVELAAARVVARFTGERVVVQDDNSRAGMVDLRIDYADRPPAYVEVVTDIDQQYSRMVSGVRQHQKLPAARLGRIWYVTMGASANVNRLVRSLVSRLEVFQAADQLFDTVQAQATFSQNEHPDVRRLAADGVIELASAPAKDGEVRIYADGAGGPVGQDWAHLDDWLHEYLHHAERADVRAKLAATHAAERHVFVGMSFSTAWGAYHALSSRYSNLPELAPRLPSEVTHVWIWPWPIGRCLAWFPDRGWFEPGRHWATE